MLELPSCNVKVSPSADRFQPYEHQQASWDALDRHFVEKRKPAGILVVPTGGGKTQIAVRWLLQKHAHAGGRILWLAHRRSLLLQAYQTFGSCAHLALPRDRIRLILLSSQDRSWSNVSADDDVVLATVQTTAPERIKDFLHLMVDQSPSGLFVVVDEAHHAASPTYRRVLNLLKERGCPLLGLTATPVRMDPDDERRMWNLFGEIIYQISKKTLVEKGVLSSPAIETVKTEVDFERDFTERDFDHLERFGELSARVLGRIASHSGRNHLIVEHYVRNRKRYGKTLVFAVDVLHARTLAKEFKDQDVNSDYVDHTRRDSLSIMDSYRDREDPQVLINVEMLTEGYDDPKTQTVFLARPTKSEALLSQMVGRALRGPRAGGTDSAFLVTFVDSWREFHPLEAEYEVTLGEVAEAAAHPNVPAKLVPIAQELILECYKLVKSNARGFFTGVHQCLPHSWYVWEVEFENDMQEKRILVFENQVDGYRRLDKEYRDPASIPSVISEMFARELVRRYFGDCPDPQPHWSEIRSYLEARRSAVEIGSWTFEEKAQFDPRTLAQEIRAANLGEQAKEAKLRTVFQENPVCRLVYRGDIRTFFEEVDRELMALRDIAPLRDPIIEKIVPGEKLSEWAQGEDGHLLGQIKDDVLGIPFHFPNGKPLVRDLRYSEKPNRSHWGWFRDSDKAIQINRLLNSPDVPRFVVEFVVYHELLHADMPSAGHNANFRERERRFRPSTTALRDAANREIKAGRAPNPWHALADQFLDTIDQRFDLSASGRRMDL
ncbi:MAG: DEAD/DEAH box helicase [Isosphaeraceae bacterium]